MIDPYEAWLGIPPEQRPPTYYQLLDVAPDERDPESIRQAAMRRMSGLLAHPDRMHGGLCAQIINEITEAQTVLLDPEKRQAYDSQLVEQTTQPVESDPVPQDEPVEPPLESAEAATPEPVESTAIEERPRRPAPAQLQQITLPVLPAPVLEKPASPVPAVVPTLAAPEERGRRLSRRFWLFVIAAEGAVGLIVVVGLVLAYVALRASRQVASVRDTTKLVSPTLLPTGVAPTRPEPDRGTKPDPDPETKPEVPGHGEARPEPKGEDRGEARPTPRHRANPQARPPRLVRPAPAEGAVLARAEKQVRDVFGDDLAKRKPNEVMAVVVKMLQQARNTRDPAARYVMLREAAQYAANAGNAAVALGAIDELAREFAIPSLEIKTAAMEAAARAPGVSANRTLVESILSVIDDAIAADGHDHAARLLKAAENVARVGKIAPAPAGVPVRSRELEQMRREFEPVHSARQMLASRPDDPNANLALGRYLCFCKGDWPHGLPHLTRSGNELLGKLAEEDIAGPLGDEDQVALADGWWDYSEMEKGVPRVRLQERAVRWYIEALPRLDGLDKEKAEKRIKLLANGQPPAGTTLLLAALREMREVGEAKYPGDWLLKGGKVTGPKEEAFWFSPYFSGDFWVNVIFVHGTTQHAITFGPGAAYTKDEFWLIEISPEGQIQLRMYQGRELTPKTEFKLEPGRRFLSVRITGREVTIFVDGQQRLVYPFEGDVPPPHRFGLYTATGAVNVESLSFGSNRTSGPRFEVVPEYTAYEGKWSFKYASYDGKTQTTADYVIDALGNLVEPAMKDRRGVFVRWGNEVFIEYADGSLERIAKFATGRLQTQTYANVKAYPAMPTAAGIGVKK